ncbi:hypothetical protein Ahy_A06g029584 isoform C [Arachis hypogaea]|uniref:Uncharacterized protein n=2 Tax=Arachis hypogaea TaxID=3818 RepID=A0A445CTW5_ARAHY|nr:hypothetical protein Ahy_A06g029584 isoform C [Arachis hypogaea]
MKQLHLRKTKTPMKAKMNVTSTCCFPGSLNRKWFPNPRLLLKTIRSRSRPSPSLSQRLYRKTLNPLQS